LINLSEKFNHFLEHSSFVISDKKDTIEQKTIKDKTLHQLRTINNKHAWLRKNNVTYAVKNTGQYCVCVDDYGTKIINTVKEFNEEINLKIKNIISNKNKKINNFDILTVNYKEQNYFIDDFGFLVAKKVDYVEFLIPEEVLKLSRKIIKEILKKRVKFPRLEKPKFILDSRVFQLDPADRDNYNLLNEDKNINFDNIKWYWKIINFS
jgi:hypothetical protein